jgi:hypothetical protein
MALFPKKDDKISSGLPAGDHVGGPAPETTEAAPHEVATITGGDIATPVKQGAKRQHKATYATDKKNGGYLIRVEGPNSNAFSGKIVPVVKRDDSESAEALDRLIWTGKDAETGKLVSLYSFVQKPRVNAEPEF